MKYLCLVFYDEKRRNELSDQESQALIDESLDFDDALRREGYFVATGPLQPVEAATTLRARNGKITVTDGPFTETNEQIGGFVLIEARDLNEAIRVASRIPPARLGGVEVRPMLDRFHSKEEAAMDMSHGAPRIALALAGDLNVDTPGLKGSF
ncbi:MAG: YciI family protein [Terracidiphilus sp.]